MKLQTEEGRVVDYTKTFAVLGQWFDEEMFRLYRSPSLRLPGLMMGCPLWGEKYIATFERYCLASMMSEQNREALAWSRLVLFTRREEAPALASVHWRLQRFNIDVSIIALPDELWAPDLADENNRYWILGCVHQLIVKMAGWHGMGFHMLLPDHVLCADYFKSLRTLASRHEAIAQTSFSADLATVGKALDERRLANGLLAIEARELGQLGLTHLHPQMRPMILNGKNIETEMTETTTWLAWKGRNQVSIYSPHMNAAYLSPRLCSVAAPVLPATLDTELPHYMPEGFYVPQASDGLVFVEVSDASKRGYSKPLPWQQFASIYWNRIKFQDRYLPFCRARGEVPVADQPDGMETAEIEQRHCAIMDRLERDKGQAALAMMAAR